MKDLITKFIDLIDLLKNNTLTKNPLIYLVGFLINVLF